MRLTSQWSDLQEQNLPLPEVVFWGVPEQAGALGMALRAQEREGGLSSAQTRAGCRKLSEQALKPGQVPLFFFFFL